jgi:hypothetical protein
LNRCFFGGHLLVTEGSIVNLVLPEEVRETAEALAGLDQAWFRGRFREWFSAGYSGPIPEGQMEWHHRLFGDLKDFYRRAAEQGRAAVFVTDDCLSYLHDAGRDGA